MIQCHHDATYQSTLSFVRVTSVTGQQRTRYSCTCKVCKRMTDWYWTKYEAQLDAWYECWLKEE